MKRKGAVIMDTIVEYMKSIGYLVVATTANGYVLVSEKELEDGEKYVVCFFDYSMRPVNTEGLQVIVSKMQILMERMGIHATKYLTIIYTSNEVTVNKVLDLKGNFLFIDSEALELRIYENQMQNFTSLRKHVEEALDAKRNEKTWTYKWNMIRKYVGQHAMTVSLIFSNLLVFLIMICTGNINSSVYMDRCGVINMTRIGHSFWYYRLLTSMFIHGDLSHLTGNMCMLLMTGHYLEKYLSKGKFLSIYMFSGIIAGLAQIFYCAHQGEWNVIIFGASGAVFGIAGALLWLAIAYKGVEGINWKSMLFLIMISLMNGYMDNNIATEAHVAGAITGFLFSMVIFSFSIKGAEAE